MYRKITAFVLLLFLMLGVTGTAQIVEGEYIWTVEQDALGDGFMALNADTTSYPAGVFGRGSKDKSVRFVSRPTSEVGIYYNPEANPATTVGSAMAAGETLRLSYAVAFENVNKTDHEYFFQFLILNPARSQYLQNNGAQCTYGLDISGGIVSFFNQETDFEVKAGRWYAMDYIMALSDDAKSMDASLYINGERQASVTLTTKEKDAIQGIKQARFGNNTKNTTDGMYLDDVYCKVYESGETAQPRVEASNLASSLVEIDAGAKTINLTTQQENLTVGEFLQSLTSGAAVLKRTDGQTAQESDLIRNCSIYGAVKGIYLTEYTLLLNGEVVEPEEPQVKPDPISWDMTDETLPDGFLSVRFTPAYEMGVFGRESGDTSLRICNPEITQATDAPYLAVMPEHTLSPGDTIHLAYDVAVDEIAGLANERFFQFMINENQGYLNSSTYGLSISDGAVSFFGLDTDTTILPKTWYRFTYLLKLNGSASAFDAFFYVNGVEKAHGTFSANTSSPFTSIAGMRFCNGIVSKTNGLYLDNIYFDVSEEVQTPDITPGAITAQDFAVARLIDNSARQIRLVDRPDMTAGEFMEKTQGAYVQTMEGEKAPGDALLRNCRVFAVAEGIYYTAYSMVTKREYIEKRETFEGEITSVTEGMENQIIYHSQSATWQANAKNSAAIQGVSGLGGKEETDQSIAIVTEDVTSPSSSDPFVSFELAEPISTTTTLELKLYLEGTSATYHLQQREQASWSTFISFHPDKTIAVRGNTLDALTWEEEKWMSLAFVYYPGFEKMDVYVNGELAAKELDYAGGPWRGLKMLALYPAGATSASGIAAMDDLRLYTDGLEAYETVYYKENEAVNNPLEADAVEVILSPSYACSAVLSRWEDGRLTDVAVGSRAETFGISNLGEKSTVKLMLWESLTSLQPLAPAKTILEKEITQVSATNAAISTAFSDNMVLQRDREIRLWGSSEDENGAALLVRLGENQAYGVVVDGKWEASLPAMEATDQPQTLSIVTTAGEQQLENILIGDVYFIGGQSNAYFEMNRTDTYSADVAQADQWDTIRIFHQIAGSATPQAWAEQPMENPAAGNHWEVVSAQTIGKFSAIGYYFAVNVAQQTGVPIGLISVAHNGINLYKGVPAQINAKYGFSGYTQASQSYNALMAPMEKLAATGMLWYQGESDSAGEKTMETYQGMLTDYIAYLNQVGNNDLTVFLAQLSSHSNDSVGSVTKGWNVPRMRAIQFDLAQDLEKVYLIPTLDKGVRQGDEDDAHPKYKKPVGERMANVALAVLYGGGEKEDALAPAPVEFAYDATGVTITFDHVGAGLKLAQGEELLGFELIKDAVATPASASLTGVNTVRVKGVENPQGVRYAFYQAASQSIANLADEGGLPCPTFADGSAAKTTPQINWGVMD